MHDLAKRLWPIHRSLTGNGVRETLLILKETLADLQIHNVTSGTRAFDWTVPDEWVIREAWIEDEFNNRIVDFNSNNLHVMGYSIPVDLWLTLDELKCNIFSLPEKPNAIPYITSYYSRRWAFCLSHNQLQALKSGKYHVVIDSEIKSGFLTYGELLIPGESNKEIFLSTYICHPSMANNELSGPVVTTALAKWIGTLGNRRYTYRIVFIPETIGSLVYISKHLNHLKENVLAGYNVTCVGDERAYSYLPSRNGNTLSDNVAKHVLKNIDPNFKKYTWLDRGSDERQYCAPGIDLPIATISRSLYFQYPEYHTSLDDLNFVTPDGLAGGFMALQRAIECIELNCTPSLTVLGEPQLGKRGLYPSLSTRDTVDEVRAMMDLLTYCDGSKSLIEIAELINQPFWDIWPICEKLIKNNILVVCDEA
jgi:aminopeptidase-like protein